ncbi:hypothetical protein H0H87_011933 [Tephrocybe sp. NHM501043]|nr:hypothetical protein H0H87_011933 [Tephrocybe sp. NHM501043]
MPDWKSPVELQKEADIFANTDWRGSYEWFISLDFDWQFVSGKKRFRWPLVGLLHPNA